MKRIVAVLLSLALLLLFGGCGTAPNIDLGAVMTEIENQVELPADMTDMTMSDLASLCGIDSSEIVQFAGKITTVSTLSDEIIMLEAKDSSSAQSVKKKLEQRYQNKLNEMENYLPEEYKKISDCQVSTNGNYVFLLISDQADEMEQILADASN